MSKQTANDLAKAIARCSMLIADNLALDLTRDDLEYVYQFIGLSWLGEQLLPGLTVGDVMRRYYPEKLYDVDELDEKYTPNIKEALFEGVRLAILKQREYLNE